MVGSELSAISQESYASARVDSPMKGYP